MDAIFVNEEKAQVLLAALKATFSNENIWPEPAFGHLENDPSCSNSKSEHETEVMAAWDDLYKFTFQAWDATALPEADLPDDTGVILCQRHDILSTCWRESFIHSIEVVAAEQSNRSEVAFLYFMMGIVATSWCDYLADLHGKRQEAAE